MSEGIEKVRDRGGARPSGLIEKVSKDSDAPGAIRKDASAPDRFAKALLEGMNKGKARLAEEPEDAPVSKAAHDAVRAEVVEARAAAATAIAEADRISKAYEAIARQPAVPAPLRTVPRRDEFGPRVTPDNGVAALEKALETATNPETKVFLRQQIGIAKATE